MIQSTSGGDDQARHQARQEESPDRLLRDDAEDDQRDARRDQDAQGAHRGHDTGGKLFVVAVMVHFRNGDAGEGGGCCRRGAADSLERRGPGYGGHRQTAGNVADEPVGRRIQPFGDAGIEGDLAHQDEKRNDREPVGRQNIEKILGQQAQSGFPGNDVAEPQEPHQGHGESEFDAGQKQQQNRCQANQPRRDLTHIPPGRS
jgi:hypothetical protein